LFDRELFRGIDSSDGLYVAGIAPDGERYARFAEAWKAKFGEPPGTSQSVLAFDATGILLNAVEKVAEPDKSGMLVIGRQALRTTIANLERYPGLSGTISCSPSGNCFVNGSLAVFTITPAQTSGERWPAVECRQPLYPF
jgi:branched-chain amino acid transport system substrate-binding protein